MATMIPAQFDALPYRKSPGRVRLMRNGPDRQKKVPYFNYAIPSLTSSHMKISSEVDDKADSSRKTWAGPSGYGARHILDDAPFSLWDETIHDFRLPTSSEESWLISRYKPTSIGFQFPIMLIETDSPPNPLPLTVAAVATKFVPPPNTLPNEMNASNLLTDPLPDARPIGFTTNYAKIRGNEDPLEFRFRKWMQPTDHEVKRLMQTLYGFCNPRLVHILYPRLIIELFCEDGRTYQPASLPSTIGGLKTHYHHQQDSIFEGLFIHGRKRIIDPTQTVQEVSNYLDTYGELCPGVRVSSGIATSVGAFAQVSLSTTVGVLLRNSDGHQRLTVSNRGFLHSSEVFHPSEHGISIGQIDERWPHLDIALAKLNPSIHFTNTTYFGAMVPKRLLRRLEIPDGAFFSVDGMSTGCIFMQAQGLTLAVPQRPSNLTAIYFVTMRIFRSFGALGLTPQERICGSPLVEEDSEGGGVAGFFQEGNADFAFSPCIDELIDSSWRMVLN